MNWKFWKRLPKVHIIYTWTDDQGRTHKLKAFNELTLEEQETMRLTVIRQALHCAVDKGLLDSNIRDMELK